MTPLPIDAFLPEITQKLRASRAMVLVAEPGAGKTTRVPPAILRAGLLGPDHPNLVMLQPRRVAALSVSRRIAEELGVRWGEQVARIAVPGRELPCQGHEADDELIPSLEVPIPVIAQKEPVVLESPCLWRLSRRLPQQDGWCHMSHFTLSGNCETSLGQSPNWFK